MNMKMKIMCDGELINQHSDGGKRWGWTNPLDVLPPIGSTIDYMTFNQSHKEGQGVLTKYMVMSYEFYTEEDFNKLYRNQTCVIKVKEIIG